MKCVLLLLFIEYIYCSFLSQLLHHTVGECPQAPVQCPYHQMGCNVKVKNLVLTVTAVTNLDMSFGSIFVHSAIHVGTNVITTLVITSSSSSPSSSLLLLY